MHGEYRRHLRSGNRVPVVLKYANHIIKTISLDISAGGLRLKRPDRLYIRPGEAINVDFPNNASMKVAATVAYTGKTHIFARPMPLDKFCEWAKVQSMS